MQKLQRSYCKIKLLYDIETDIKTFKKGEIHTLTGISYAFMALKIGTEHYHCLYKDLYEILEENKGA